MSDIAIKIENLSKQYRLGVVGTGTISHDLNRWWARIRGKEDPYLKVGQVNKRELEGNSDYVWALKDINIEVRQGEVLGIIGKNGAGKSTLLKILSRVTGPTTGLISAKGRMGTLLEVGTGFHPELTGRENVFLNGAILGMTKAEIKSKLDEIVSFSGCARYIDTPVKRYSSGMKVRLAFAVAAFLEPEILIVDEVLAVGDVEFQKKAIGKMQDVSKGEGRTVLFVSHNMSSIKSLCTRAVLLQNGKVGFDGPVEDCINRYISQNRSDATSEVPGEIPLNHKRLWGSKGAKISHVFLSNEEGKMSNELLFRQPLNVNIRFSASEDIQNAMIQVRICAIDGTTAVFSSTLDGSPKGLNIEKGEHEVNTRLNVKLNPGEYCITVFICSLAANLFYDSVHEIYPFRVLAAPFDSFQPAFDRLPGFINEPTDWDLSEGLKLTNL